MPFSRYIQAEDTQSSSSSDEYSSSSFSGDTSTRASMLGIDAYTFSNTSVGFQIPQFMLNGPPTLAYGGGAEVLPASMHNSGGHPWFTNAGFHSFSQSNTSLPEQGHYSKTQEAEQPQAGPSSYNTTYRYLDEDVERSEEYKNQSFADAVRTPEGSADQWTAASPPIPLSVPPTTRNLLSIASTTPVFNAPSSMGLPVYSASGFDLLSVLARVANRPNPKIALGPVDLTCAFVVVDVRRYDSPIVYASPTFCQLTGYSEAEVLGRNCRFLQSPNGQVKRGEERRFVAPETVQHMYKSVVAEKECQASIINYRKGGQAFINLVTIIPVPGGLYGRPEEADDIVYHVGFQVDLTEQPNTILQKLKDGSYIVNYGDDGSGGGVAHPLGLSPIRDRRMFSSSSNAVSKTLKAMLADSAFLDSLPITKPAVSNEKEKEKGDQEIAVGAGSQTLSLILLENSPDFVLVLSLKGSFLYVAPSVRRVLGFEADELVGKSIGDYCHPADLVPLMRELKESSTAPGMASDGYIVTAGPGPPKTVDLLFRAQAKSGNFIWIECRGRLHVEPGKGRKAIILSGRARGVPSMLWGDIAQAGGVAPTVSPAQSGRVEREREFWGMLSRQGTLLVVGGAVRDVLGWGAGELIGRALVGLVSEGGNREHLIDGIHRVLAEESAPFKVICEMSGHEGQRVPVQVILYRAREHGDIESSAPVICQVQLMDASISNSVQDLSVRGHGSDIFEELETSRGSSWQYELQQLKFANQRLVEEVNAMEASVASQPRRTTTAPHSFSTSNFGGEQRDIGMPISRQMRVDNDWATPQMHDYDTQRSLKRSWGEGPS